MLATSSARVCQNSTSSRRSMLSTQRMGLCRCTSVDMTPDIESNVQIIGRVGIWYKTGAAHLLNDQYVIPTKKVAICFIVAATQMLFNMPELDRHQPAVDMLISAVVKLYTQILAALISWGNLMWDVALNISALTLFHTCWILAIWFDYIVLGWVVVNIQKMLWAQNSTSSCLAA